MKVIPMSDCSGRAQIIEVVKKLEAEEAAMKQNEPDCTDGGASGMCSCNKSRGYDDLLERYQQLEQVAKEMWRFMLSCAITIEEEEEVEPFKIQLETLGVSLDD